MTTEALVFLGLLAAQSSIRIVSGLTLLGLLLSFGKFILMPLTLSALFAIPLAPLSRRLERLKLGRAAAIVVSMVLVAVILSGIL